MAVLTMSSPCQGPSTLRLDADRKVSDKSAAVEIVVATPAVYPVKHKRDFPPELKRLVVQFLDRTDLVSLSRVSKPWRSFCNEVLYAILRPTSGSDLFSIVASLRKARRWHQLRDHPSHSNLPAHTEDGLGAESPLRYVRELDFSELLGLKSNVSDHLFLQVLEALSPWPQGSGCPHCPRARLESINISDCFQLTNHSLWTLLRTFRHSLKSLNISFCNLMTLDPQFAPQPADLVPVSPASPGSVDTELLDEDASLAPTFADLWPPPGLTSVAMTLANRGSSRQPAYAGPWAVAAVLNGARPVHLEELTVTDFSSPNNPWTEVLQLCHETPDAAMDAQDAPPYAGLRFLSLPGANLTDDLLEALFRLLGRNASADARAGPLPGLGLESLDLRGARQRLLTGKTLLKCIKAATTPPRPLPTPQTERTLRTLDLRGCPMLSIAETLDLLTSVGPQLEDLALGPRWRTTDTSPLPDPLAPGLTLLDFLAGRPAKPTRSKDRVPARPTSSSRPFPRLRRLFLTVDAKAACSYAGIAVAVAVPVDDPRDRIRAAVHAFLAGPHRLSHLALLFPGIAEVLGPCDEASHTVAAGTRRRPDASSLTHLIVDDLALYLAGALPGVMGSVNAAAAFTDALDQVSTLVVHSFDETQVAVLGKLVARLPFAADLTLVLGNACHSTIFEMYDLLGKLPGWTRLAEPAAEAQMYTLVERGRKLKVAVQSQFADGHLSRNLDDVF
ncbi:hypothetical protein HDU96_009461 [Phlyctochytrium bullatum]|nr:hypothetical protein HDU96_009461 [Phlyctochytrium bullatum]